MDYLLGVDVSQWVTYTSSPNFGHKMSNIVESMNSTLREECKLSILDLLNEIWHLTITQQFKQYERATELFTSGQIHTDFCLRHLTKSEKCEKWAQKNVSRIGD